MPRACAMVAAALSLVFAPNAPAVGAGPTGEHVGLEGCQESLALIPASAAQVRRHVPLPYRIVGEEIGVATLAVRVFACDRVVVPGSRPRPTLGAQFGVTIESPDGTGRAFGSDLCCNWYAFFWVTDNEDFAGWLTDGTGLGGIVRYVPHLAYRYEPGFGASSAVISFAAPAPTPSPFVLKAVVATPPGPWPPGFDLAPNWWAHTAEAGIKFANEVPGFRPYQANGEVSSQTGSRMATLFGAARRTFGSPFSYGRWDRSYTTKHALP